MKKKEKIQSVTKMSYEELCYCFLIGIPFKCGRNILKPCKAKAEYPCNACNSRLALLNIQKNIRTVICGACISADSKVRYNWTHYIEIDEK